MLGKPLSAKQSAALIRSIQRRVPFQSKFSWTGEIVLTRKQVRYANAETIARIRQAFTTEPKGFAVVDTGPDLSSNSQPFVIEMSANSPVFVADSPSLSPDFLPEPLNTKGFDAATQRNPLFAPLSSDTTLNETRRNSEAREITPTGHDVPSSHHDTGTSTLPRVVHSTASPTEFGGKGVTKTKHRLGEVALWLNDGLTGTILIDGIKRQLIFSSYHTFEHRFYTAHSQAGHRDWWQRFYQTEVIGDLVSRWNPGNPVKSMDFTHAVSGIYDDRAGREPVDMCLVARLFYDDKCEPVSICLISGTEIQYATVSVGKGQNANSPHWKAIDWKTIDQETP